MKKKEKNMEFEITKMNWFFERAKNEKREEKNPTKRENNILVQPKSILKHLQSKLIIGNICIERRRSKKNKNYS